MRRMLLSEDHSGITRSVARWPALKRGRDRTRGILLVAALLVAPMSGVLAGDGEFPRLCAEKDLRTLTLIEQHGANASASELAGPETLARSMFTLIEARRMCAEGRVPEAVAAYDTIVTGLGPTTGQAQQ